MSTDKGTRATRKAPARVQHSSDGGNLTEVVAMVPDATHEAQPQPEPLARLAAGVKAAVTLRLIAGDTDQTYTPTEVATIVAEIVDAQLGRLAAEEDASR